MVLDGAVDVLVEGCVSPPVEHVVHRAGFFDADPVGADAPPAGVVYADSTTFTGPEPDGAAAVRARAGLLRSR